MGGHADYVGGALFEHLLVRCKGSNARIAQLELLPGLATASDRGNQIKALRRMQGLEAQASAAARITDAENRLLMIWMCR